MFTKLRTSVAMAVISAITPAVMAATPVLAAPYTTPMQAENASAQAAPATSVSQAAGPLSGTIEIPAHGSQWFKFKYSYDNSDADNEPTQAVVELQSTTVGAMDFEVWTLGRMSNPQQDDENHDNDAVKPVGVGTPLLIDTVEQRDNDGYMEETEIYDYQILSWAGSQKATDTFYILVKNTSDAPVSYTLAVSGPDVSY